MSQQLNLFARMPAARGSLPTCCTVDYPAFCGQPLTLLWEHYDEEARVWVALLECPRGHRWMIQRPVHR